MKNILLVATLILLLTSCKTQKYANDEVISQEELDMLDETITLDYSIRFNEKKIQYPDRYNMNYKIIVKSSYSDFDLLNDSNMVVIDTLEFHSSY
jgi:hypothetical protein